MQNRNSHIESSYMIITYDESPTMIIQLERALHPLHHSRKARFARLYRGVSILYARAFNKKKQKLCFDVFASFMGVMASETHLERTGVKNYL
jgi:hypothetical protein